MKNPPQMWGILLCHKEDAYGSCMLVQLPGPRGAKGNGIRPMGVRGMRSKLAGTYSPLPPGEGGVRAK